MKKSMEQLFVTLTNRSKVEGISKEDKELNNKLRSIVWNLGGHPSWAERLPSKEAIYTFAELSSEEYIKMCTYLARVRLLADDNVEGGRQLVALVEDCSLLLRIAYEMVHRKVWAITDGLLRMMDDVEEVSGKEPFWEILFEFVQQEVNERFLYDYIKNHNSAFHGMFLPNLSEQLKDYEVHLVAAIHLMNAMDLVR